MKTKKILLALVGASMVVALGCFWSFGGKGEELRLPGVVEAREIRLGSKVGGRVEAVLVNEGDTLKAGQSLVRIEAPELKAQIEQWQAKLRSAEAAWEKAENGPRPQERESVQASLEGSKVRLSRLEKGERDEDRRSAEADLAASRAELRFAQEEFNRIERTYRQSASTASELDSARSNLHRLQARVAFSEARLERTKRGRVEDIEEARAEVKRLTAEFELMKETRYEDRRMARANVEEIQGRLHELKANLAETEVRAPGNAKVDPEWRATVEVLAVRRGDIVAPNQPVMKILQSDDRWVKVYVPETELGKIRLQQAVEVKVDSYPGKRFKGTVIHITSEAEFTPRNVQSADERKHQVFGVKVRVEDEEGVFKSGMAAEVFVPLAK